MPIILCAVNLTNPPPKDDKNVGMLIYFFEEMEGSATFYEKLKTDRKYFDDLMGYMYSQKKLDSLTGSYIHNMSFMKESTDKHEYVPIIVEIGYRGPKNVNMNDEFPDFDLTLSQPNSEPFVENFVFKTELNHDYYIQVLITCVKAYRAYIWKNPVKYTIDFIDGKVEVKSWDEDQFLIIKNLAERIIL